MIVYLIAIFFLLLLSGFFSGSETALTAASRPLMHRLEQEGNQKAVIVNRLHAHKDHLISTILLGNNLVNILASALATSVLITLFGEAGVAYAAISMTLLVLLFSEILPKTYAFRTSNKTALNIAPLIGGLVFLMTPITVALQLIVCSCFRIFGIRLETTEAIGPSSDELRGVIDLRESKNETMRKERAMLRSVLDLQKVEVGAIMTHRTDLVAINADDAPDVIIEQVLDSTYSRLPLWRDEPDNIIGVLHAKALFRAVRDRENNLEGLNVTAFSAEPWFIPETTLLYDQLQAFQERHEHFALVVDEYGSLQGIVTLEDILEEIVGNIDDEHDMAVEGVRAESGGSYLVDGTVTIRDLNREFEWQLPDKGAATLAGLLLHDSRRIPKVGQVFTFHNFRFEVLARERNQITLVRIMPLEGLNDYNGQETTTK